MARVESPAAVAPRAAIPRPGGVTLLRLLALAVAATTLVPFVVIVQQVDGAGWARARHLLRLPHVSELLQNTLQLALAVPLLCGVIGVGAAWLLERTDVPARRLWAVLLVMPLAIPEFVNGYAWVSLDQGVHGFSGALLVSTLSYYPFVFLPAAAVLRRADPGLEEMARSLGVGGVRVFLRITLPQLRLALLGGGLIIALHLLGEYGAFALLGYRTFTTEIYNEYQLGFDAASAAVLSLVLLAFCLVLLAAEGSLRGSARLPRVGGGAARSSRRRLGLGVVPALLGLGALVALALGLPIGVLVYWLLAGGSTTLPSASIAGAALATLGLSLAAAAITTLVALPVALLAVRHPTRFSGLIERSVYLPRAMPGLVVALALATFAIQHAFRLYQSSILLVAAYAILFVPLALVALRPALMQASPRLEETARSLGTPPLAVLWRVTLPLIAPALAAAAALVFLSCATELTATLVLRPTGTETLATRFWTYTSGLSYGAAAPYAALMIAVSAVPTYILLRKVDALADAST